MCVCGGEGLTLVGVALTQLISSVVVAIHSIYVRENAGWGVRALSKPILAFERGLIKASPRVASSRLGNYRDFIVESWEEQSLGGEGLHLDVIPYSPPSPSSHFLQGDRTLHLQFRCGSERSPGLTCRLKTLGQKSTSGDLIPPNLHVWSRPGSLLPFYNNHSLKDSVE